MFPVVRAVDRPTLSVAMVGYAFMGRAHSNAWRSFGPAFRTDPITQRLLVGSTESGVRDAAFELGWEEYSTDWKTAIARSDIDIVDICVPGNLHDEIAIAALAAGKHVIVEKPMANTLERARLMASAAHQAASNGTFSMVGFNYRRVPALALARDLIRQRRLGEIRQVRIAYHQDWLTDPLSPMSWRLRRQTAGSGALGDLASHAIDQLHFLLDDRVKEVTASTKTFVPRRPGPNGIEAVTVDDAVWATLFMESGAVASVEATRVATGRKNALMIEIFGELGSLCFDLESMNELKFYPTTDTLGEQGFRTILVTEPEHPYLKNWWPTGHILGWSASFTNQMADFVDSIRQGVPPAPSFDDGLAVQCVLDAIERSAAAASARTNVETYAAVGPESARAATR